MLAEHKPICHFCKQRIEGKPYSINIDGEDVLACRDCHRDLFGKFSDESNVTGVGDDYSSAPM